MDAAVNDELLQRQTGNFAANRVETQDRVIASGVSSMMRSTPGQGLQCADVASLTADDAALHFVIRQRNNRYGCLCYVVGSAALNGRGDNFSRILFSIILGLLLNLAQLDGCIVLCLLLDGIDKILLGFIAG